MNWRRHRIAVLDCETTGTDPAVDHVIEIGGAILDLGAGGIVARDSWLVSPVGIPVGESVKVHGITDAELRDAPPLGEVMAEVVRFVGSSICAGYNAAFDRALMIASCLRTCTTMPPWLRGGERRQWIDVMVWAREHFRWAKGKGRHKLGAVAGQLGVPSTTMHRAQGDAVLAAGVLAALSDIGIGGLDADKMPDDLEELLTWQRILAAEREADFLRWLVRQSPTPTTPTEATTTEPAA